MNGKKLAVNVGEAAELPSEEQACLAIAQGFYGRDEGGIQQMKKVGRWRGRWGIKDRCKASVELLSGIGGGVGRHRDFGLKERLEARAGGIPNAGGEGLQFSLLFVSRS